MPQTNAKVAIELYVDDKGTLRVREFGKASEKAFEQTAEAGGIAAARIEAAWNSVKAAWVGIVGSIMAMREAWDLANMAAKAQQAEVAFGSLAASYGTSGKIMLDELRAVSNGTVSTMAMVQNGAKAMMMGLNPENVVQLMKIAMATTRASGQSVVQAFEDIALASARESKMIMDNLGIIVSLETANENYAKANHVTASSLTDVQQKQAFLNETFRVAKDLIARLGNQTDTQADKLARLTATFENIKGAVGSGLLRVFSALEGSFEGVAAASLAVYGGVFKIVEAVAGLTDKLRLTSGAAAAWKINAEAAFGAAENLALKSHKAFEDMVSSNDGLVQGMENYRKKVDQATTSLEVQERTRQKIIDKQKSEAEQQAAAEREMYEEAGIGAKSYFSQEATALVKKAQRWKKAGADTLEIEEWLYDELGKLSEEAWTKGEWAAGQAMDSIQQMYGTLLYQFDAANASMTDTLTSLGIKVEELNGSDIGISARFDGSAVITGIDSLVAKFAQLRAAASAAAAVSASASGASDASSGDSGGSNANYDRSTYYQTTVNVNQQLSRSDVTSILNEQSRQESRK